MRDIPGILWGMLIPANVALPQPESCYNSRLLSLL
jgi:hypothetical protein